MKTKLLLAMLGGLLASTAADAAVMTYKWECKAVFGTPANKTITSVVEFSLDPSVRNSATLISFTSDGGEPFTNATIAFTYYPGSGFRRVYIGRGAADSIFADTEDFGLYGSLDANGMLDATSGFAEFARAGESRLRQTRDVTITDLNAVPAAVPEPATWAMMLGGFGLVGAAMRRRPGAVLA